MLVDHPKEYGELKVLIQSGRVGDIEQFFNVLIEEDQFSLGVNTFSPFGLSAPTTLPPSDPRKSYTDTGLPELHSLKLTMQS